ncbi:17782_t:CDS:2, partial [Cetraspora pellucida]
MESALVLSKRRFDLLFNRMNNQEHEEIQEQPIKESEQSSEQSSEQTEAETSGPRGPAICAHYPSGCSFTMKINNISRGIAVSGYHRHLVWAFQECNNFVKKKNDEKDKNIVSKLEEILTLAQINFDKNESIDSKLDKAVQFARDVTDLSQSGQVNRVQALINELREENKRLKEENAK